MLLFIYGKYYYFRIPLWKQKPCSFMVDYIWYTWKYVIYVNGYDLYTNNILTLIFL